VDRRFLDLDDLGVDAFNHEVDGLDDVELWIHTCWGNPNMQKVYTGESYANSIEIYLERLKGDVWTVEATENQLAEIDLFKPYAGRLKKKVAVGVVNHRTLQADMPPVVAARVRRAMEVIPADKLILSSDCGFGRQGFSRTIAFYKATAIAGAEHRLEGARARRALRAGRRPGAAGRRAARPGAADASAFTLEVAPKTTPYHEPEMTEFFRGIAHRVTLAVGSWQFFMISLALLVLWAGTGPLFQFSDTWQLLINTSTTILTYLLGILILLEANRQAKESKVVHDAMIEATRGASNVLVNIDEMTDEEMSNNSKPDYEHGHAARPRQMGEIGLDALLTEKLALAPRHPADHRAPTHAGRRNRIAADVDELRSREAVVRADVGRIGLVADGPRPRDWLLFLDAPGPGG
jgi:low affinity Fe/Cu permease